MGIPVQIVGAGIDWPAWVQAVGSVGALAALFIAQRIDHANARGVRAEEARERNQRLARASLTAAKFVTASIAAARNSQADVDDRGWIGELVELQLIDLEAAMAALRDVDRGSLPDEQAVVAVVNLAQAGHVTGLLLRTIREDIDAGKSPKKAPLDAVLAGAEGSLAQLRERWESANVAPI